MATDNKYISLAYKLYWPEGDNQPGTLMEEAPAEHPLQFISGMGLMLDAFEAQVLPLKKGDTFDFCLSIDDAYGPYVEEGVQNVPRSMFEIDGKLNAKYIYEGAVVPLMNSDGERFNGTITQIAPDHITVDLNHPLAGKPLRYVGTVVEHRDATNKEMEDVARMLSGEGGCGGNCGNCNSGCNGGCGGDCGGCE